jgi:hypothetical protein
MRTCTFCLATNADDAPYCATCGRSGPPARTDATPSAPGAPTPGFAPPQPPPPGFATPPATPYGPPPAPPYGVPPASPYGVPPATPYGGPPPPPEEPSKRGPLVLVIGATGAALLLLLAAYLGSQATPAPKSGLKHARVPTVTVVVPRSATIEQTVSPMGGARGR